MKRVLGAVCVSRIWPLAIALAASAFAVTVVILWGAHELRLARDRRERNRFRDLVCEISDFLEPFDPVRRRGPQIPVDEFQRKLPQIERCERIGSTGGLYFLDDGVVSLLVATDKEVIEDARHCAYPVVFACSVRTPVLSVEDRGMVQRYRIANCYGAEYFEYVSALPPVPGCVYKVALGYEDMQEKRMRSANVEYPGLARQYFTMYYPELLQQLAASDFTVSVVPVSHKGGR